MARRIQQCSLLDLDSETQALVHSPLNSDATVAHASPSAMIVEDELNDCIITPEVAGTEPEVAGTLQRCDAWLAEMPIDIQGDVSM